MGRVLMGWIGLWCPRMTERVKRRTVLRILRYWLISHLESARYNVDHAVEEDNELRRRYWQGRLTQLEQLLTYLRSDRIESL